MLRFNSPARALAIATATTLLSSRQGHLPIMKDQWQYSPENVEAAYRAQEAFIAACGFGNITGYKIGATNAGARAILKLQDPFYGVLFDKLTMKSGVTLKADSMFLRVIEPEIALQLDDDLVVRAGKPITADDVKAATGKIFPAIEIVDTPFASSWKDMGGLNLIADNGAHGLFVLGEPSTDIDAFDPLNLKVSLSVNLELKAEGKGSNVDGGAFAATAWLANTLAQRGVTLQKGQIITTGSKTVPHVAKANEAIVASFEGVGHVELNFE